MSVIQQLFSDPISVPIPLEFQPTGTFTESAVVDNTTDRFISADIQLSVQPDNGSPGGDGFIKVYLMRSLDNVEWDDPTEDCTLLAVWTANQGGVNFTHSIDTDVVGNLPPYWKILVENRTGTAFDGTGNSLSFVGKKFETV
jgi:hypothetical protein